MANYLKMAYKQQIVSLIALGWSNRRIARETGAHRDTVARYRLEADSKPAKAPTGSTSNGSRSGAAPYHDLILSGLKKGLTAQRIFEDLVFESGYAGSYDAVKRYARALRGANREVVDVLHSAPGEEAQVDYFSGVPALDETTGRYKKTWVFQMTLACSRHSYEEAVFDQKLESFIKSHERAFAFFGGVPRVVRLDNLRSGVARACLYDPDVNEVYHMSIACIDIILSEKQEMSNTR